MGHNLRELSTINAYVKPKVASSADSLTDAQKNWGYVMAVFGAAFFSLKAVVIKLAYASAPDGANAQLDPLILLVLRMSFALPIYVAILIYALRETRGQPKPLRYIFSSMGLGAIGYYICSYLDFLGLVYITAQLERLLLFTYPIFVLILGVLFFGQKITRWGVASIATAYAGIAVIFAGGDIASGENVALGASFVLLCALFFAIFQILAKPVIDRVGSRLFTCYAMITSSTAILLHFSISYGVIGVDGSNGIAGISAALSISPRLLGLGFILGIFCTVIPSFLINIAIGRIGAQAVSTVGMVSPLITILAAIWLLGEPFSFVDGLGTALTVFGVGLYTYFDKKAAK